METTFLLFPSLGKQLIFLPSTPPKLSTVQCPALRPHARVAACTILPSLTTRNDKQTFSQQLVLRFYMYLILFNFMYMYIQPLRITFQIHPSRRPPDFYAGCFSGNSEPFYNLTKICCVHSAVDNYIFQIQTSRRPPDFYAGRFSGTSELFINLTKIYHVHSAVNI